MYKKIFFDANIIADIFDDRRNTHKYSVKTYLFILENQIELFTSCDIITTIYYIEAKYDKKKALEKISNINQTLSVIDFSNKEVTQTYELMKSDINYIDLEDTIQYILAKKAECDLIISNDKNFVSKDIELLSSKEFCEKFNL